MNLFQYINIPVFMISLLIGIVTVYLITDEKRRIFVYPNHENFNLLQYKDKTNTCFDLVETEIACPSDSSKIFQTPIQS
jgi:hypothetical protein